MSGCIGNVNYLNGALPIYAQMCNPYGGGCLDTYDIDLSSPYYGFPSFDSIGNVPVNYNSPLGANSSMYYSPGDIYSYTGGLGFGTMPYDSFMGGGIYNNQDYYRYMEDNQKFYNDYNINQYRMQRNAAMEVEGPLDGMQEAADNLKRKINENEQGQVMGAYNAFIESIKNAYGESNPENLKGKAQKIYANFNQKKIDEHLKETGHNSFVQGLLSTMTGGFYYRRSAEDNIAEITGQPVGSGDKFASGAGRTVGAVGFGLITAGLAKGIGKLGATEALTKTGNVAVKAKGAGKYAVVAGLVAAGLSLLNSLRD